jgi:hypothetical protein
VDDGDGMHVLEVKIRLSVIASSIPAKPNITEGNQVRRFLSAAERKKAPKPAFSGMDDMKVYARKDIRVGDTVRVIGRIKEWFRGNAIRGEFIREITVDDGQGGSIGRSVWLISR